MADKSTDSNATTVNDNKLDNGYSAPTDTRTDPNENLTLNTPGADFSHLKGTDAERKDLPLDNTPAGKALGHSDGRPMTQDEAREADDIGGK